AERPAEPVDQLLVQLRKHLENLDAPAALADAIQAGLAVPGGPSAEANRRAIHRLCKAVDGTLRPAALLCFAPFWVREPAALAEDRAAWTAADLVRALFGRYAIPAPLTAAFAVPPESDRAATKWMSWAVALGAGAGLKAAGAALGSTFGWTAPGRFQACFERECARVGGASGDPAVLCLKAEVARLVADRDAAEAIARRLLGVPFFRIDPTALTPDDAAEAKRAFWTATVGWLARHGAELTDPDARDVLAWAAGRFAEIGFSGQPGAVRGGFVWRGRTARGALTAVREEAARKAAAEEAERRRRRRAQEAARRQRRQEQERARQAAQRQRAAQNRPPVTPPPLKSWQPRGWDWEWKWRGSHWRMIERTSARGLRAEGRALKHCAGGYAHRCSAGVSAVFGLTLNGEPRLTVEVDPHTGKLLQARGAANRDPMPEESIVVEKWLRRHCRRRAMRRHG
ncbi:MAG: PcfJ domain-containing protein, partial [Planctomycetota bacterium]